MTTEEERQMVINAIELARKKLREDLLAPVLRRSAKDCRLDGDHTVAAMLLNVTDQIAKSRAQRMPRSDNQAGEGPLK